MSRRDENQDMTDIAEEVERATDDKTDMQPTGTDKRTETDMQPTDSAGTAPPGKHSPRTDDELERETRSMTKGSPIESRASEARLKEPAGDDEPVPEEVIRRDER